MLNSVRVSNELGKGNAEAVKFSIRVILSISVLFGILFGILCFVFDRDASYLFTSNKEVAETVSSLSVLLSFTILLISVQSVLTGKYSFSCLVMIVIIPLYLHSFRSF